MGSAVWLNVTGLDDPDIKTHSEIVVRFRQVLEPLCIAAGKTLTITKGDFRGDLNLEFDSVTDTIAKAGLRCGVRQPPLARMPAVRVRPRTPGPARLRPVDPKDRPQGSSQGADDVGWLPGPRSRGPRDCMNWGISSPSWITSKIPPTS
jgi:hypothetical protein